MIIGKILQISFYDDEINDFDKQIEELRYITPGLGLEKTTWNQRSYGISHLLSFNYRMYECKYAVV